MQLRWLYMGKIQSDGNRKPAVLEVRSSDTDNLLTLDLQSTNPAKGCSRNYPQGSGPQALFLSCGGRVFC